MSNVGFGFFVFASVLTSVS